MEISRKDLLILSHLRNNARKSITQISKETGIPITSVFDRLHKIEKSLIKKNTSLIDFPRIGYPIRIIMIINKRKDRMLPLFLQNHVNVNHLLLMNVGNTFYVEAIYRSMKDRHEFIENLKCFNIRDFAEYCVLEELKKEDFLTKVDHFNAV